MGENTSKIFLTEYNAQGELTIDDLKLEAHVKIDNTAAEVWAKRGSISSAIAVGPLLQKMAWINRQTTTHLSVSCISKTENKEAYVSSFLTYLHLSSLLHQLKTPFAQPKPWRVHQFLSSEKHTLCTMLFTKRLPQGFPISPSGKTTQHGGSGKPY